MIEVTAKNVGEVVAGLKAGALPAPAKTLAEAVCRVMEAVGYVQKDKQMQGGGSYRYVSVEAVIDALRPEMIRQQLVMLPSAVEPMTVESFEGKNGGRQNRTQVKYTFTLTHAPSQQTAPVVVIGEAIDVGDKSSNKAMTAARKYALIMAFNIETGLDPDDTPSERQERAAAPATKPTPKDNPALRDRLEHDIKAAKSRGDLTRLWQDYDAALKRGNLGAGDKAALDPLFQAAAAKFPKPQPQPAKGA